MRPFVVLKFGGTSVSTAARWQTIATQAQARAQEGLRPLVVCSALSGVSDLLERLLPAALGGGGAHEPILAALEEKHRGLAEALGVAPSLYEEVLAPIRRLAVGVALTGEITPRLTARVMAQGEVMSTRLGVSWMQAQGLSVSWLDARALLVAPTLEGEVSARRRYLSARVPHAVDPALIARLSAEAADILVTQGFIAATPEGETVLLGRGGSDTSATTLAAKLGAVRCEIWTDVPGMFTANPRQVPSARLLKALDYDEAQELASTGAKVLHPASVWPVQQARIPLEVRSTPHPELPHTTISTAGRSEQALVKAISARHQIVLVVMETVGMWQQVGFLADVFACFRDRGLSVDLITTSESNVTASLDATANVLDEGVLAGLLADLGRHCRPSLIRGCASVSIVGRNIRGVLHELAPAFALFEEHRVYLVSQAASDLNLTVVVEQAQVDRLTRQLHALLFAHTHHSETFGPTWDALFPAEVAAPQHLLEPPWWVERQTRLLQIAAEETPTYAYNGPTVTARARELAALRHVDRVLYAMKANPNPDLMRRVQAEGLGFECVSPGEVQRVRALFPDLPRSHLLFTPNFAPRHDYVLGFDLQATVTLDNLHPLQAWPEVFAGQEVFVRVDPGQGRGHHAHVKTGGASSKFGVSADQLPELMARAAAVGCRIVGLHAHAGSGIRTPENWREVGAHLARLLQDLPDVRVLDVGGGLGVPETPGQSRLDLDTVDRLLGELKAAWPHIQIWIEPGRYLVAEAGVLLTRVTQRKDKSSGSVRYVGVDAGMHSLIRPALYGAHHQIVNLSRLGGPAATEIVNIVGPICETGDVLGHDRALPPTHEGDVLLIATAGAYGYAMASQYNLRGLPREVVLD